MIKTLLTRLISEKKYRKLCKSHKFNIIGTVLKIFLVFIATSTLISHFSLKTGMLVSHKPNYVSSLFFPAISVTRVGRLVFIIQNKLLNSIAHFNTKRKKTSFKDYSEQIFYKNIQLMHLLHYILYTSLRK